MTRFYGKPTKFIRHNTDESFTLTAGQRQLIPFWKSDTTATARVDGQDLTTKTCPLGSRITKHRVEMMLTPSDLDPQEVYIGVVKLSFHDVMSPYVNGFEYHGGATPVSSVVTSYLKLGPNATYSKRTVDEPTESAVTLSNVRLDDNFKHWVSRLKKIVIFDQQPLVSDRFMKIPSKVKRINEFTWYGLFIYNNAGANITFKLKQYFEEWAI